MELREGYKQTEVGVIPEDWEVKQIFEFSDLLSSKRIFESDYVSTGIPFYRGTEISLLVDGKGFENKYYITREKYDSIKRHYGAPKRDEILITAVGTLANVHLIEDDKEFYFKDGNLIWLRNIKNIDVRYLATQLRNYRQNIINNAIGSSQKALTIVVLKKTPIPLPPIKSEQTAIANALSDADALIQSLTRLIAKKRQIKQGAMQTLLNPHENGRLKVGWVVKKLGDVAHVEMGQSPSSQNYNYKGVGLPLVQGNADIKNRKTIIRAYTSEITKKCSFGDIIMSVRAPVGEIAVASFDACIGRGVCAIKYPNKYIYHYLISIELGWGKLSKGSTFDSVTSTEVKELDIFLPEDTSEQNRIATILSDMDADIAALETKLAKTQQIKQGMMQNLLTGKIRLI